MFMGGWGQGPGGPGGDWGEPRRRRQFGSGDMRLLLLKLIADEPRHGYDLIRAIEEITHGSYVPSPGVIYPTLTMLEDMGVIVETESEGSRKVYTATPEGLGLLEEKKEEVVRLLERLAGMGEGRRKARGGPIGRAVKNLLTALWQRVMQEEADEARVHEIAAILDEAAQRIERLK
jgi:DNA-binding PadR family transcriptional regulator